MVLSVVLTCNFLVSVYIKSTATNLGQYVPLISKLTRVKAITLVTDITEIPEGCQSSKIYEDLSIAIKVGINVIALLNQSA